MLFVCLFVVVVVVVVVRGVATARILSWVIYFADREDDFRISLLNVYYILKHLAICNKTP